MDDPNGRFHLVEAPALSPAEDWVTRTTVGPFIDTGVDIEFAKYGRLYLSVETIREMAEVAGLFDSFRSIDEEAIEEAREEGYGRALKEGIVEHLGDYIRELGGIFSAATGDGDVVPPEPVDEVGGGASSGDDGAVEPEPTGSDDPAPAVESDALGAPEPDGQGDGSGKKRRPARVPVNSGDGGNPFRI